MNDIESTQTTEPSTTEPVETRRDAMQRLARISAGLGMASLPLGLATLARKLEAQAPLAQGIVDSLNSALVLEWLQSEFYVNALGSASTIVYPSSAVRSGFTTIRDQELEHVVVLRQILGAQAISKPTFDFTGGGQYAGLFDNYSIFLTLATAFEDLAVRGYKGLLPSIMSNDSVLSTVMSIHSVEGRHASHIRRLAGSYGVQGWIAGNQSNAPAVIAPVYAGEDATIHNTINLLNINLSAVLGTNVIGETVTEAFDEPLSRQEVAAILAPFTLQVNPL